MTDAVSGATSFPVSIKGLLLEAGRVVLSKTSARNGSCPADASKPVKIQKPASFANSPKNWA